MATAIPTAIIMAEDLRLLRLLTWLSPSFPVGGFGYSHGLEQAIRQGLVDDADSLFDWIADLVEHGGGWSDAVLLNAAHAAAGCGDLPRLSDVAELAGSLAPSLERRRETVQQGQAFASAVALGWPSKAVSALPPEPAYCVAVGAAGAAHGVGAEDVVLAFLHAFAANLVAVALRAAGLGQKAGVSVLARLEGPIAAAAGRASRSSLDDLGGATIVSDIMSMRHETLDGRLFIS